MESFAHVHEIIVQNIRYGDFVCSRNVIIIIYGGDRCDIPLAIVNYFIKATPHFFGIVQVIIDESGVVICA